MGIENIVRKAILLSKTTVHSPGSGQKDIVKFLNKNGEPSVFTVFKDEFQRPMKKVLVNNKTGAVTERSYTYDKYTFTNGETVPYKVILNKKYDAPKVPLRGGNLVVQERSVIATVPNGEKLDVTKTKSRLFQRKETDNIFEKSYVARFSNGKKAVGVSSLLERTPQMDIISKKNNCSKSRRTNKNSRLRFLL